MDLVARKAFYYTDMYLIHSTVQFKMFIFHVPSLPGLRHGEISLIAAKVSAHRLLLQCLLHLILLPLDVSSSSLFPTPNEFITLWNRNNVHFLKNITISRPYTVSNKADITWSCSKLQIELAQIKKVWNKFCMQSWSMISKPVTKMATCAGIFCTWQGGKQCSLPIEKKQQQGNMQCKGGLMRNVCARLYLQAFNIDPNK